MDLRQSLRHADWLDGSRVRGYAVLLGLASLALLVNSHLKAMTPTGSDFLAFWGAGHVAAAGDPAAAYDLAVQERVQTATEQLADLLLQMNFKMQEQDYVLDLRKN